MITALLNRLAFVVLFLVLSISSAQAQCPSGWTYGGTRTVQLDWLSGCDYIVEYCYRVVGGKTQYLFTTITVGPHNNCPREWDYVFENIGEWFVGEMQPCSGTGSIPPCSGTERDVTQEVMMGTCWEIVNMNPDPTGEPVESCQICFDETGYCLVTYERCCDSLGHINVDKTGSTLVTSGGCQVTFNPMLYVYNQCYIMLSCE